MPKENTAIRLNRFARNIGDGALKSDGKVLLCTLCNKKIGSNKKYQVEQHLKTNLHKEKITKSKNKQELILHTVGAGNKKSDFNLKLCEALLSADIPFWKLENPTFRKFLEEYTGNAIPHESTLRKNYLSTAFEKTMNKIIYETSNKKIWVSIDETTDVLGRYIANVVVGTLDEANFGDKPFILNVKELEKTNSTTIAQCFDESINILGTHFPKNNVLLFLSDAAPYMVKAGKGLKLLYPNMIHVTCVVHGLHNLAETIRDQNPNINKLIAVVKRVFLKAPSRILIFKEIAGNISLPPQPVLTRWGTWLEAVVYYATNFQKIKDVFDNLRDDGSMSIPEARRLLDDVKIKNDLVYISENFGFLPQVIQKLESRTLMLPESLAELSRVEAKIMAIKGPISEKIRAKFMSVFYERNPGLAVLKQINQIIFDNTNVELEANVSPENMGLYKYANLTSVEVERSFSKYKALLSDRRQGFTFENLKMHFIVHCNIHE